MYWRLAPGGQEHRRAPFQPWPLGTDPADSELHCVSFRAQEAEKRGFKQQFGSFSLTWFSVGSIDRGVAHNMHIKHHRLADSVKRQHYAVLK